MTEQVRVEAEHLVHQLEALLERSSHPRVAFFALAEVAALAGRATVMTTPEDEPRVVEALAKIAEFVVVDPARKGELLAFIATLHQFHASTSPVTH